MNSLLLLRWIPLRGISRFVGRMAARERPRLLVQAWIRMFVKLYRVDVSEISQPVESYASFGAFFARELKSDARPFSSGLISPVDGRVTQVGDLSDESCFPVKGSLYSLKELLGDGEWAKRFTGGVYVTVYLAPPDYHRIHSPVAGEILEVIHLAGSLWPVHRRAVDANPRVLLENERVATFLQTEHGKIAVVKVGATNVGSIRHCMGGLQTNQREQKRAGLVERWSNVGHKLRQGDELARFEMGSTVILLLQRDRFRVDFERLLGRKVRMGERLGDPVDFGDESGDSLAETPSA